MLRSRFGDPLMVGLAPMQSQCSRLPSTNLQPKRSKAEYDGQLLRADRRTINRMLRGFGEQPISTRLSTLLGERHQGGAPCHVMLPRTPAPLACPQMAAGWASLPASTRTQRILQQQRPGHSSPGGAASQFGRRGLCEHDDGGRRARSGTAADYAAVLEATLRPNQPVPYQSQHSAFLSRASSASLPSSARGWRT